MVHASSIALPLWCLLLARCGDFSCFGLVVVLFLCLMGPVWHCECLVGEEGAGYFVFRSVTCVRRSLVTLCHGTIGRLCSVMAIFYTTLTEPFPLFHYSVFD